VAGGCVCVCGDAATSGSAAAINNAAIVHFNFMMGLHKKESDGRHYTAGHQRLARARRAGAGEARR